MYLPLFPDACLAGEPNYGVSTSHDLRGGQLLGKQEYDALGVCHVHGYGGVEG